jgi:hypothetical protein
LTTNNKDPFTDAANLTDVEPTYQNDNYVVFIFNMEETEDRYKDGQFEYDECYVVVNRANGVVEHACVRLPEACFIAFQLDKALRDPPWDWPGKVIDAASEDNETLPIPPPSVN